MASGNSFDFDLPVVWPTKLHAELDAHKSAHFPEELGSWLHHSRYVCPGAQAKP